MADWRNVTEGLGYGGYVAWEAAVSKALPGNGRDYVPVFVALKQPDRSSMSLADAINATESLPDARMSRHERDLLCTERELAKDGGWPHDVRLVAYWPRSKLAEMPPFWRVLQVGPALAMPPDLDKSSGENLRASKGDLDPAVPVAAVIDDGIGFLNARFRAARDQTRIRAVWMQAPERVAHGPVPLRDVVCGQVLTKADIDAHLAAGGDEAEIYSQVNRAVLPITDGALTNQRTAHGTQVLDLAAGSSPLANDPMRQVPILAVQLPPASIRETAGRRMETYLVQGLRWILAEVLRQANETDVPPVVLNLSLGTLAGPGDQHAFLAEWFAYEVARHARMCGGATLRLVIAYGNARLSRLVARDELRLSHPMELIWRVQPDDHTSSHLELRADTNKVKGLWLRLTPPVASGLSELEIPWPEAGQGWQLDGPLAAVTSVREEGGQSLLQLSLGPTAAMGELPACPPGAWNILLRTTEIEPVRVTAKVQRDDTPLGYPTLGRQSWLDHPHGWDWDEERRGYVAPRAPWDAPGCPVTRDGTYSAYAGAQGAEIKFVGAARPLIGEPGAIRAAHYSSEGARYLLRPGESVGPTLLALGDSGVMLPGLRAAGVVSGSVARMSGTSMAAPQVARSLLCYFLNTPVDNRTPEAECLTLTGVAEWKAPDPRTGQGLLIA